jgi:diguanylate cyclase (GGDEF)-like protein
MSRFNPTVPIRGMFVRPWRDYGPAPLAESAAHWAFAVGAVVILIEYGGRVDVSLAALSTAVVIALCGAMLIEVARGIAITFSGFAVVAAGVILPPPEFVGAVVGSAVLSCMFDPSSFKSWRRSLLTAKSSLVYGAIAAGVMMALPSLDSAGLFTALVFIGVLPVDLLVMLIVERCAGRSSDLTAVGRAASAEMILGMPMAVAAVLAADAGAGVLWLYLFPVAAAYQVTHAQERLGKAEGQLVLARRDADVDGLTGLLNRRTFRRRVQELLHAGDDTVSAVIMIDLDHFKRINDTQGHAAGDEALIVAATCLSNNARDADIVARWGGEEFIVFVAASNGDLVLPLAERLRSRLEQALASFGSSASVGVAISDAQADVDLDELIGQADSALYRSKSDGRNRVSVSTPA